MAAKPQEHVRLLDDEDNISHTQPHQSGNADEYGELEELEDKGEDWNEVWDDSEAKNGDSDLMQDDAAPKFPVADCVWLFLHYLQLLAILQSLGLRWAWPESWLRSTSWLFLFNLDIWEFSKFYVNSSYINVQGYYFPSANMGNFNYWYILAVWAGLFLLGIILVLLAVCIIVCRKRKTMMVQIVHMKRTVIFLLELTCLPFGAVIAKVFHCTDTDVLDVDNTVVCFSILHWAYMGAVISAAVLLFILFPIYLIRQTRSGLHAMTSESHEVYFRLIETKDIKGRDMLDIIANCYLFSPYKRRAAYFRAVVFYLCLALLIPYAALNSHMFTQAVVINCILFIIFISFIILQPYKMSSFNNMLLVSYVCLNASCLLGSMVSAFKPTNIRSLYLTREYIAIELVIINIFWLICFIIFVVYLWCNHNGRPNRCCKGFQKTSMTSHGLKKQTHHTRKYIQAVLKGRRLIDEVLMELPLFAPVHLLSHQIQVTNAFCREAQCIQDPVYGTLYDLLDELITTHEQLTPHSLYSDNNKLSTRHTVEELKTMMPMFVRRLAQREYDFLLVEPVKRRLLFKMYILAVLLSGRKTLPPRCQQFQPAIQTVWERNMKKYNVERYYEDMYPEPDEAPLPRPASAVSLGCSSILALEEVDFETEVLTLSNSIDFKRDESLI